MNQRPDDGGTASLCTSLVSPRGSWWVPVFYRFLPRVSARTRRGRMTALLRIMEIKPGTRVLDLGGTTGIWEHVSVPLDITILNLPEVRIDSVPSAATSIHTFHHVDGDACNVHQFPDRSFDLVFSNSVIEHVGPCEKQEAFAREAVRLGTSYWVQTPSAWFPIEAHSGLPFYWFYPEWLRAWLLQRSQKKLPKWWTEYIAGTRVLSRKRMAELFPNARIHRELLFGLTKSYVAYVTVSQVAGAHRGHNNIA